MKRIIALVAFTFVINSSFATVTPSPKAADIFIPIGTTGQKISLLDLSFVSIKEAEKLTGKKMKFTDRLAFKAAQKNLRDNIAPDCSFNTKRLERAFNKYKKRSIGGGFHLGGFLLGFFLGPIGVLITYIVSDDYNRERRWSAWRGLIAALTIAVAIVAATGGGY